MNNNVNIHLTRLSQYQDQLRKYKVILDGLQVGEIEPDETLTLQVPPGEHQIYLKIDWTSSNTLVFNAHLDQDIYLECGNNVGRDFRKLFLALTIARDSYLYLKFAQ